MPPAHRRLTAAAAAALLALAALPAAAGAVAPPADQGGATRGGPRPFLDVRQPAVDRAARRRLVRTLGRQAVLDADPLTGTPRVLGKLNGTLTGPRAGDPADIALDYVRDRAPALGLSEGDLTGLRPADRYTARGVTHLRWQQVVRGVPAYDNDLRVNVDGDGRVINVLGTPRHALSVDSVRPALSAAAALEALQRNVGVARDVRVTS